MDMQRWVDGAARAVEMVGVLTIIVGGVVAAGLVIWRFRGEPHAWYPLYRRYFGHALLLGLEFLVAADIIRTVSHIPTLEDVLVLGLIVLIRTFLSFTLEVELGGHWPWQKTDVAQRQAQLRPRDPPPA